MEAQRAPQEAPEAPKDAPRDAEKWSKRSTYMATASGSDLGAISEPFWTDFGALLGAQTTPKRAPMLKKNKENAPNERSERAQRASGAIYNQGFFLILYNM